MRIDKTITNIEDLAKDAERLNAGYREAVGTALFQEASKVMNNSQDQCPVRYGVLRASGYVSDPYEIGTAIKIDLGYSANYAIYVHENLEARHLPPTKAKYLEDPVNLALPWIGYAINERLNALVLESGYT